jgi:hypothetical protein
MAILMLFRHICRAILIRSHGARRIEGFDLCLGFDYASAKGRLRGLGMASEASTAGPRSCIAKIFIPLDLWSLSPVCDFRLSELCYHPAYG